MPPPIKFINETTSDLKYSTQAQAAAQAIAIAAVEAENVQQDIDIAAAQADADAALLALSLQPDLVDMDSRINYVQNQLDNVLDVPQLQLDIIAIQNAMVEYGLYQDPVLLADEGWTGLISDPKDIGAFTGIKSIDLTYITFSGYSNFKKGAATLLFDALGKFKYSDYINLAVNSKQQLYLNVWSESIGVAEVDKIFYAHGAVNVTTPSYAPIVHGTEIFPLYHADHAEHGTILKRTDTEFTNNLLAHNVTIDVDGNYHQLRWAIDDHTYVNNPTQNIFNMAYTKIFSYNNELTVYDPALALGQGAIVHPALDGVLVGMNIAGSPINPKFIRFTSVSGGPTLNPIYSNITIPVLATNAASLLVAPTKLWFRVPSDFLSVGVLSSVTQFTGSIYHGFTSTPSNLAFSNNAKFTDFNPANIFDNGYGSFALSDLTLDVNQSWYSNQLFSKVNVNAALIPDPKNIRYFKSNLKPYESVVKVEYIPGVTPTYDIWFRSVNGAAVAITPFTLGVIEFFDYELDAIGSATAYIGSIVSTGTNYVFEDSDGATPVIMSHNGTLRDRVASTTGTYTPYATQDTIFAIKWNNSIAPHGATIANSKYVLFNVSGGVFLKYPIIGYSDTDPTAHLLFFRAPVYPTGVAGVKIIHTVTNILTMSLGNDLITGGPAQIFPAGSPSPTAFNPLNISDAAYGYFASALTTASPILVGPNNTTSNSNVAFNQMSYVAIDGQIPGGYSSILSSDKSRIIKLTSSEYSGAPAPNGTTWLYFYDPSIHSQTDEGFFYGVAPLVTFVLDNGTAPITRNLIGAGDAVLNNPPVNGPNGPQGFARTDYTDVISTGAKTNHTLSTNPTIIVNNDFSATILDFKLIDDRKQLFNGLPAVIAKFDSSFQELLNGTPVLDGTNTQEIISQKKYETVDTITPFTVTGGGDRKYLWKIVPASEAATVPDVVASVTAITQTDSKLKFRHLVTSEVQIDGSYNIYVTVYAAGAILNYTASGNSIYGKYNDLVNSTAFIAITTGPTDQISIGSIPADVVARDLIVNNYTYAFIKYKNNTTSQHFEVMRTIDVPGSTAGIIKFTTTIPFVNGHNNLILRIIGTNNPNYSNDYIDVDAGFNLMNGSVIDVFSDDIGVQRVNKPIAPLSSIALNSALYTRVAKGFDVSIAKGVMSFTWAAYASARSANAHFKDFNLVAPNMIVSTTQLYGGIKDADAGGDLPTSAFNKSEIFNIQNTGNTYYRFRFNNIEYGFDFNAHAVRQGTTPFTLVQTLLRVTIPTIRNNSVGLIVDGSTLKIWAYSTDGKIYYWFYNTSFVKTLEGSITIGGANAYKVINIHKREDSGIFEAYLIGNDNASISRIISDTLEVWKTVDTNPIYVNPETTVMCVALNKFYGLILCNTNTDHRWVNLYQPYRVNNFHGTPKIDVPIIKNILQTRVLVATDVENVSALYGEVISNNLIPRKIGQGDTFIDFATVRHANTISSFAKINGSLASNPLWECTDVPGFFGTPVVEVNLIDVPIYASTFYDSIPPKGVLVDITHNDILFPTQALNKQVSTNTDIMVIAVLEWVDDDKNLRRSFILMKKGVNNLYNEMEAVYTYPVNTDNAIANI